jgi:hypothetical protein
MVGWKAADRYRYEDNKNKTRAQEALSYLHKLSQQSGSRPSVSYKAKNWPSQNRSDFIVVEDKRIRATFYENNSH